MIKMVAPSMAYRVIDRAIQVSTECGPQALNHLQHMQSSLTFSCPTACKLQQSPVVTPSPCMLFSFFCLRTTLQGRPHSCSHLECEQTEAQKSEVACPGLLGLEQLTSDLWELGPCYSRALPPSHAGCLLPKP